MLIISDEFRQLYFQVIRSVDIVTDELPLEYLKILQLAEDHRNHHHFGVDQLSFFRIIFLWVFRGKKQGGSTIEQQLVRTVTNRYELTIYRKVLEQLLAVIISTRFSKLKIASAYLNVAYLGSGINGLECLANKLDLNVNTDRDLLAVECVIRLKYPEPLELTPIWVNKYSVRKSHIMSLLQKTGNNCINTIYYTRL
ncbi:transglycosylase domain-containing protein [Aliivibrio fischeri]|uniref:transglycosylase domain-containing protein n=1 Tax=Aliivibrio fischeri TaxID=668 RepID=UPI0011128E3C|nr:transglycosylase domain-containing protein [Aliivibrio fischeri]